MRAMLATSLPKHEPQCLGHNADMTPRHPLMLSYQTPLEPA